MNPQSILPEITAWFDDYVEQFSSDDPIVQESMDLKKDHTRRVRKMIVNIGASLDLSKDEMCIAEVSALLHDIGRFEQYRQYGTFSDHRSEDHAMMGVKIIQTNRVLHGLGHDVAGIIIGAVQYHNHAALPVGQNERCLFFLKLLRDADKVDIWRVVTEYYQKSGNNRNRALELDLPDTGHISTPIYKNLMNGKVAKMSDLKTLTDFKLLQIGWVYDINFLRTFEIIKEKRYLETIYKALPRTSTWAKDIYERSRLYLECNLSVG